MAITGVYRVGSLRATPQNAWMLLPLEVSAVGRALQLLFETSSIVLGRLYWTSLARKSGVMAKSPRKQRGQNRLQYSIGSVIEPGRNLSTGARRDQLFASDRNSTMDVP